MNEVDLDKLRKLFTELGIGFSEQSRPGDITSIVLLEGADKIEGYSGFYAEFDFDEDGSFLVATVAEE